jgi:hypothetical protein
MKKSIVLVLALGVSVLTGCGTTTSEIESMDTMQSVVDENTTDDVTEDAEETAKRKQAVEDVTNSTTIKAVVLSTDYENTPEFAADSEVFKLGEDTSDKLDDASYQQSVNNTLTVDMQLYENNVVSSVVFTENDDANTETFGLVFPCGVTFGMTIDDVKGVCGEPKEVTGDDSEYVYIYSDNYQLSFKDNYLHSVTLSE